MNDLIKTEFFVLITESSQEITNEEMQSAYGSFIQHVEVVSSENDYTAIYRNLSYTRIELLFLSTQNQYEQGKKCA
ncbi:hypothetical protein [Dysgonomonas sp. ZJ279]|uniref:hypothetical protein n=1 Tax=Dysgonomonas sp. ZJ279 TaxID=2709796 RepID=UPI002104BD1D|nr:hypothetical protein [Dysgonomonas sp. ZJ279]